MSRRKGVEREQQAANIYREAGYRVETAPRGRFTNYDYFDLFDLMCLFPGRVLRFVQVKSNTASGIRQWLASVPVVTNIPGIEAEYAVPVDEAGWRLIRPTGETYATVYDERKDPDVGPHVDTPKNLGEGLADFLAEELENGA